MWLFTVEKETICQEWKAVVFSHGEEVILLLKGHLALSADVFESELGSKGMLLPSD